MGDPVELIIFLLENICKIDSDFIHKLFYIDLSEVYVCGKCSNKVTLNYDKDHFVMEIYIKEILNYINLTKMDFQLFNNRLLSIENEISTQTQKKCEKCQNLMDEKRLCNSEHRTGISQFFRDGKMDHHHRSVRRRVCKAASGRASALEGSGDHE